MKKKLKYALIVGMLLTIIATSFLVGCNVSDFGKHGDNNAVGGNNLAIDSWMSYIKDDTLLTSLVIPGSHDTGTYDLSYLSQTQSKDLAGQLACGTRYFDLRYDVVDGELVMYHGFHGILYKEKVMYDVNGVTGFSQMKEFLQTHPSETLILDITNIFEEAKPLLFATVCEYFKDIAIVNNTAMSDIEFVDSLQLGDCRGKCLILWGSDTDEYLNENYIFKRNDDHGNRKDSVLHSFYVSKYNSWYSSEKYINKAIPEYIESYRNSNGGLFVLQGQLTDGLAILGPRSKEDTHYDTMNEYVLSLAENKEVLDDINIIMRDFVGNCKNSCAIKLNLSKGYVIEQYASDFEEMTNYYITNDDEEPGIGIPIWLLITIIVVVILLILIAILIVMKNNIKAKKIKANGKQ